MSLFYERECEEQFAREGSTVEDSYLPELLAGMLAAENDSLHTDDTVIGTDWTEPENLETYLRCVVADTDEKIPSEYDCPKCGYSIVSALCDH